MDTQTVKSQNGAGAEAFNMTEAPYSVNFLARNASGYEFQFTVRAITEDGLVLRMEKLIGRLQATHHDALPRSGKFNPQPAPATRQPDSQADEFDPFSPIVDNNTPVDETEHGELRCPKCGDGVWDNRAGRKPGDRRPLIKCKNPECDYRIWPAKKNK